MADQPANTAISVFRTVRTRTDVNRNASIKQMAQRLGTRVVIAPGEEIDAYYALADTAAASAAAGVPGPNPGWRYGMPVVLETRTRATVNDVYAGVASLAFPVKIVGNGNDLFIEKAAGHLTDDLHTQVRAVAPLPRGLFRAI
jgi:hypothetical protein